MIAIYTFAVDPKGHFFILDNKNRKYCFMNGTGWITLEDDVAIKDLFIPLGNNTSLFDFVSKKTLKTLMTLYF
jgi:hypothetical protein